MITYKKKDSPSLFHDGCVTAVASAAGLTAEHVEVVSIVVAFLETLGTERHARRDAARATPIRDEVRCPNETARSSIVISAYCTQQKHK